MEVCIISGIAMEAARLIDVLPEADKEFAYEFIKKLVLAWNPDFTKFSIIQATIDARKASGLTQKDLAEKTGIAQGEISRLENGNANPSLNTLKRLANGMA